jgi:polysaccharide export outer membrane protein
MGILMGRISLLRFAMCILLWFACAQETRVLGQTNPRYTVRIGDTLVIEYRLTPEFNQTSTVQPDGYINLPLVGEQKVAGLSMPEVRALIGKAASVRLRDPEITITLKEFERPYFVVAGEVPHPGKQELTQKMTALQAVLLCGGFQASAQKSDVYVFRRVNGDLAEVHRLNLKGIKSAQDLSRDMVLEPGDMILVTKNKLEYVGRFIKTLNLGVYFDPLTEIYH